MEINNYEFFKEIKELKNELAFESFLLFEWLQEEYIAFNFKFKKYLVFDTFDDVLSFISNSIWNDNDNYFLNKLHISYWSRLDELNGYFEFKMIESEQDKISAIIKMLFNKFMYVLIKRLNKVGIDFDVKIEKITRQVHSLNNSNIISIVKLAPEIIFEYNERKPNEKTKRYLDNLIININKYLVE